jgi:hypothetical protein
MYNKKYLHILFLWDERDEDVALHSWVDLMIIDTSSLAGNRQLNVILSFLQLTLRVTSIYTRSLWVTFNQEMLLGGLIRDGH